MVKSNEGDWFGRESEMRERMDERMSMGYIRLVSKVNYSLVLGSTNEDNRIKTPENFLKLQTNPLLYPNALRIARS